jgi:hypothetical protein
MIELLSDQLQLKALFRKIMEEQGVDEQEIQLRLENWDEWYNEKNNPEVDD